MRKKNPQIKDRRLLATSTIAGSTLGMLILCVPLCAITKDATLPVFAIAGSSLATAAVWLFGRPKNPREASEKQVAALEATLLDLQQRLENVETINRYETTLAEEEARGDRSQS